MVATVGVAVPFVAGAGVADFRICPCNQAIFYRGGAHSDQRRITARVFGDLHALASVEARTVLGAAVADDVMGLVILTWSSVGDGRVSLFVSIAGVVVIAIGFLVVFRTGWREIRSRFCLP